MLLLVTGLRLRMGLVYSSQIDLSLWILHHTSQRT
jgi:hypothetical protein